MGVEDVSSDDIYLGRVGITVEGSDCSYVPCCLGMSREACVEHFRETERAISEAYDRRDPGVMALFFPDQAPQEEADE